MATYAIGDIQGCYDELRRLLEVIHFDENHDRLWVTGDLVNRGPRSLEVLRFVRALGDKAVVVLGNHDLHLLAVAQGISHLRPKDSFMDVLEAHDRDGLLEWLRRQPLLHDDPALGYVMIHAGLPPQWGIAQARDCAREAERIIRGPAAAEFFRAMYSDQPAEWRDDLVGLERLRFIVNCLTRLRVCDAQGRLILRYKGTPGAREPGTLPWFEVPGRKSAGERVLFGHWSALGRYGGQTVFGLDSGCVWGGQLTALRLEDQRWFSVDCEGACAPGED
jgi:bis(5'-nucleosyl)-tetraphosphatase (symmetrical)